MARGSPLWISLGLCLLVSFAAIVGDSPTPLPMLAPPPLRGARPAPEGLR